MSSKDTPQATTPAPKASASVPIPKMRRGLKSFYRDIVREMKHVTWPSRQESMRLTGVVLAVCVMIVLFLTVLSVAFDGLFRILFRGGL